MDTYNTMQESVEGCQTLRVQKRKRDIVQQSERRHVKKLLQQLQSQCTPKQYRQVKKTLAEC